MRIDMPLPVTAGASAIARESLDGWLNATVGLQTASAIRLATTELVTNAVCHAGLGAGESIRLLVDATPHGVRVDVEQRTAADAAPIEPAARGIGGGFGLAIVETVTDRWGVTVGEPGRVWFEVSSR